MKKIPATYSPSLIGGWARYWANRRLAVEQLVQSIHRSTGRDSGEILSTAKEKARTDVYDILTVLRMMGGHDDL